MRRYLIIPFCCIGALMLISWGRIGHRTIGRIAENHLSAKAKAGVQALLGDQSLADVANWADDLRNDPEYQGTASWHFINVPLGLTFEEFEKYVSRPGTDNVYTSLLRFEHILADPSVSRNQKIVALKFIVHFAGDIHQPMHVSRAEDKGGNMIALTYDNEDTNLHSLWDTKLLEHERLSDEQLAAKLDHPTDAQVKKWQSDPVIIWAWESYMISTQLYAEVDDMHGHVDNGYYETHIPVVENRIEKAGIRLAGILNAIFD